MAKATKTKKADDTDEKDDTATQKAADKAARLAERDARHTDGKLDLRFSLAEIRALSVVANDALASGDARWTDEDTGLRAALLTLDAAKISAATSEVPVDELDEPLDSAPPAA